MNSSTRFACCAVAVVCFVIPLRADVKLPAIFGDHMILQQEAQLPVWGTAEPGEKVTVTIGAESGAATAGADDKWMVKLAPLPAGTLPVTMTMTVTGKNTLKFGDVLVGDVWVCSGQSNMEFALTSAYNSQADIARADDPQLRIFRVKDKASLEPVADMEGRWELASPASVPMFSAVAYYFGRELRSRFNRPIGLIGSYWGGTAAQSWVSFSGLQKDPPFTYYIGQYEKNVADFPQASTDYPAKMAAYTSDMAQWQRTYGAADEAAQKEWNAAVAVARAANQVPPGQPKPAVSAPKPPIPPDGGKGGPIGLYNGMIAPLIPYAMKGVIWYQGESNANNPTEYLTLFPRLIADWREKWGQGDFPFVYVQLAKFNLPWIGATGWAHLREAQLKSLSVPNTGMAIAYDVGDPGNIHPKDKLDVGLRLALVAEHVAYGQNLVYSGPIYDSMKVVGNSVTLSFTQTGSGLVIGAAPWNAPGVVPPPKEKLVGFQIAGDDRKWVDADAKIDGQSVIVLSPQVPQPVAARYGWGNAPDCNLYNQEGLPASPFRTDDWPEPPAAPKP
ncbi:MAG TPA: sialate O-acetylesterase [Candidatus Methylacidiphilales bacterium]